ncbi:MAG: dTMP kinase [Bacteroidota bacterium]|nr:dTMP kinase [Bacteroidota bacterium]
MLITFEGIDGCGKTTQAKLLAEHLRSENTEVLLLREPGGTELSEQVRAVLLNKTYSHPLTAESELLLFAASRAQLVSEVIQPTLARGATVILDRFTDSTVAYQGFGRGVSLAHIDNINKLVTGGLEPDLTFLIDLPLEVAANRRKEIANDRIESENSEFHQKVLEGYWYLADQHRKRIHVVDGTRSVKEIEEAIWKITNPN